MLTLNRNRMAKNDPTTALLEWYRRHPRPFPWRRNRDPYRIWISETMLQQTTATAVIPYFEAFLSRFPTLETLASAPLEEVLEAWSGLGYYSRARNLHKSALSLKDAGGFPKTHGKLQELPGFGPYTSRAVASLAFDEQVGVLDGNVIRVLSRVEGQAWEWWRPSVRARIQERADAWVHGAPSHEVNQALMDLGREVCRARAPACMQCPLLSGCSARARDSIEALPLPKPRRAREFWSWQAFVHFKNGRVLLERNDDAPFLKRQWTLPGRARRLRAAPARFDYKHAITHHDIFVTVELGLPKMMGSERKWIKLKEIRRHAQASLVHKALAHALPGATRGTFLQRLQVET